MNVFCKDKGVVKKKPRWYRCNALVLGPELRTSFPGTQNATRVVVYPLASELGSMVP